MLRWILRELRESPLLAIALFFMLVGLILLFVLPIGRVDGRDLGQWENSDPVVKRWYQSLMQPDNPTISCCGEADAYWCDAINVKDGKTFCTITDDRPDEPLKRRHVPIGTQIEIPNHKLTYKDGNPTGHSIIFLSSSEYVWCFVMNGGV